MLKKVMLSMVVCVLAVGSAQATVVFFDNFESQPLGNLGTSVPVGLQWNPAGTLSDSVVVSSPALDTQSLKMMRGAAGSGDGGPNLQAVSTSNSAVVGNTLKYSWDMYGGGNGGYGGGQVYLNLGAGTMGGFLIGDLGKYQVLNNGVYTNSTLTPSVTAWDHIELYVYLTDAGSGKTGGTYDAWVTKSGGTRTQIASGYTLVAKTLPDTHARMTMQQGAGATNYYDNVKIEVVPEPATVSILGLGLLGLLRRRK